MKKGTALNHSSVQTDASISPRVPAEFITYDEFFAMKNEKEEIEGLLQESMNTIQLLKEKYDTAAQENMQLKEELERLQEEKDKYKSMALSFQDLIQETQTELKITKKLEEMIRIESHEKGIPSTAIELSKALLRSEIEFNDMEQKLIEDMKKLADESCDCLVEIETNHALLLDRFPSVNFEKKEERDPYKGIPRRQPVPGQPVGFLFGSPSKRFPISPDSSHLEDPDDHEGNNNDAIEEEPEEQEDHEEGEEDS